MRGRCGRGEPSGSGVGPASRAPAVSERGGSPAGAGGRNRTVVGRLCVPSSGSVGSLTARC